MSTVPRLIAVALAFLPFCVDRPPCYHGRYGQGFDLLAALLSFHSPVADGNARSHSLAASTDRARIFSRDAARHVYFNKEAFAGLALGLLGGAAWKWNHVQHRQATQEYYRDLAKSKK